MPRWPWLVAALALFALPPVYLTGTREAALYDGDEAIYAQMAREMVATRAPLEPRWGGAPIFPRPPASVWPLAVGYALAGDAAREPVVRWVNAGLCGLEVALTFWLGLLLFGATAGLCAAGLLAGADLFVGYARVYESEPLLCCCVLASLCAWALRDRRPRWWIGFGLGLAGALLTKQLVGALPLVALVAGRLAPAPRAPGAVRGLLLGLAPPAAWSLVMLARHGRAFVEVFFVNSLAGRASSVLLQRTRPSFYLKELLRSEGVAVAVLFLAAAAAALLVGLRRRRAAELAVGAWALGVLAVFSLARSRYDYYLLLAYPAFALASGWLLAAIPLAGRLRATLVLVVVSAAAAVHLPRNLGRLVGDDEARALFQLARDRAPGAPLFTHLKHPYTARLYTDRRVSSVIETEQDERAARNLEATGMPAPTTRARRAGELPRPSLLVLSKRNEPFLDETPRRLVAESPSLRLYELR